MSKSNKLKIGLATGAYDILHVGHIQFLKSAKSQCSILIVGINTDEVIRKYKGADRPINSQEARKLMLESIKYVDKVFIFNTWEVEPVISKYKPDVYFITQGEPGEEVKIRIANKYGAKIVKLPSYNSTPATKNNPSALRKIQRTCPFYYLHFKDAQKPKYMLAKISSTDIIKKLEGLVSKTDVQ